MLGEYSRKKINLHLTDSMSCFSYETIKDSIIHNNDLACVVAATVVDHIVPHRGDRKPFWDAKHNWQAFYASCHSRKTVLEDNRFGD